MAKNKNKPKEINFYESYMYDPEAEAKRKAIRLAIIPLVVMCILVLGVFGYLKIDTVLKNNKIDEMNEYMKNPSNITAYEETKLLIEKRDSISNIYTELETTRLEMGKVPAATSVLLSEIKSKINGAEANSYSFDSATGNIMLDVNTLSVKNVPMLIDNLQRIPTFQSIEYKGYEGEDADGTKGEISYRAIITCKFNS